MSQGNPGGKNLQTLLNEMVTAVTGTESTGDPEGAETTEENSEENAEGESDVAEETAETSEEEASDESAEADSVESE